jgi:hypothetical protein
MNYWPIPRMWPNSTIFILGGGPSLPTILNGYEIHAPVIGVNDAFRFGPWTDVCWFGDARWYWWNKNDLSTFKGLKVTCNRRIDKSPTVEKEDDVHIIRFSNSERGICQRKDIVCFNSSSGASAINLAYHFGANRIVLVGFDMCRIDGKSNWRPHPVPKSDKPYTNLLRPFKHIASDAKKIGLEILNATPESQLKEFPFVSFKDALCLS